MLLSGLAPSAEFLRRVEVWPSRRGSDHQDGAERQPADGNHQRLRRPRLKRFQMIFGHESGHELLTADTSRAHSDASRTPSCQRYQLVTRSASSLRIKRLGVRVPPSAQH